jgi:hypothetical protein
MVDIEIAMHSLAIEGAGPSRVTPFQEAAFHAALEAGLSEQISHNLRVVGPHVRHLSSPCLAAEHRRAGQRVSDLKNHLHETGSQHTQPHGTG